MAQAFGTDRKGGVNVDLNIVPFIDVMSCLTAFLLVTAVWISTAHLKNEAQGQARGDGSPPPKLVVLIEHDAIFVTKRPSGEVRELRANDWPRLEATLVELHPAGDDPPLVEIAATSTSARPVPYQSLIAAMDAAIKAGFPDVGVIGASSLTP